VQFDVRHSLGVEIARTSSTLVKFFTSRPIWQEKIWLKPKTAPLAPPSVSFCPCAGFAPFQPANKAENIGKYHENQRLPLIHSPWEVAILPALPGLGCRALSKNKARQRATQYPHYHSLM
jgi:hypothetical protein